MKERMGEGEKALRERKRSRSRSRERDQLTEGKNEGTRQEKREINSLARPFGYTAVRLHGSRESPFSQFFEDWIPGAAFDTQLRVI